jgi:hypothetical protein
MNLTAQPEHAGRTVRCPGCDARITVPIFVQTEAVSKPTPTKESKEPPEPATSSPTRGGWVESDPTNPNVWIGLGLGLGVMAAIMLLGLALHRTYVYTILFERGWVNYAETFVFSWGIGVLILKFQKLKHQRNALLLDVLPARLGREITQANVGQFIEHVYKLPHRLRDSMMVNRIRKGLELFESRASNSEVAHMMTTQSEIDSIRIAGSYSLVKVFIWAIPILGFIGTVLGLSSAIGNFQGVMGGAKDIDALMGSLGGVTAGLGTSFDTTLLGLIYSMILSFPMSALQKSEEDSLNVIDAYCNETLLPRLNDAGGGGSSQANGDVTGAIDRLVNKLMLVQKQLVSDLNSASVLVREQVENLERRANTQTELVQESFVKTMKGLQQATSQTLESNVTAVTSHVAALERALSSLNQVLVAVGENQVQVEARPRGWFSRLLGRR